MKQLKNAWLFSKDELLIVVLSELVMAVIGTVIGIVIFKMDPTTEKLVTTGSLMILVGVFIGVFVGTLFYSQGFNMMVTMSRTRRETWTVSFVVSAINILIEVAVVVLYSVFESRFLRLVIQGELAFDMQTLFLDYRFILMLVFGSMIVRLVFGALSVWLSTKVFWVMWLMCIAFGVLVNRVEEGNTGYQAIQRGWDQFSAWGAIPQVLCLVAVTGIVFVISLFAVSKREARV